MMNPTHFLKPEEIELIPVDPEVTLFFHTTSLQIYPLKTGDIKRFVCSFKQGGYSEVSKTFTNKEIEDICAFITTKIESAPKTIRNEIYFDKPYNYREVILPISAKCNLSCPYCFAQSETGFNFGDFQEKDINKIVKYLSDNVETDTHNPLTIIFFGGEPLINFPIMKYTVKLIKEKYPQLTVNYSITTNGTIADQEIIDFLVEHNIIMLLSLDGPDNEFNLRRYKDGSKSLYNVLNNIEKFRRKGLYIQLRATIVSDNPYLFETYKFFESLRLPFSIVFAFSSNNKTHTECVNYDEVTLKRIESDYELLTNYYIEKFKTQEMIYDVCLDTFAKYLRFRYINSRSCAAGTTYYTITSKGDIFSCSHLMNEDKYKMGSIDDNKVLNKNVIPVNVNDLHECTECWAKNLCLGGCVSQKIANGRANDSRMDLNSCALEKTKWHFYIKLYYYAMKYNPDHFSRFKNSTENRPQPCD